MDPPGFHHRGSCCPPRTLGVKRLGPLGAQPADLGGVGLLEREAVGEPEGAVGDRHDRSPGRRRVAQPRKFGLVYRDKDNTEKTPLCIHRAPLGTHERFIGFLIEHYAGNFPVWLAPEQVRVIPITDAHVPYAEQINARLVEQGVRSSVDAAAERMNAKIRSAQLMKVPYMPVVGEQEAVNGTVSLRRRDGSRQDGLTVDQFVAQVVEKIKTRAGEL